jgi:hypothetical protein
MTRKPNIVFLAGLAVGIEEILLALEDDPMWQRFKTALQQTQ